MENVSDDIRRKIIAISNDNLLLRSELEKLRKEYAQLLDQYRACQCIPDNEHNGNTPPMEKL